MSSKSVSQMEFDNKYITAHEIGEQLKVHRSTVLHARRRGVLPGAILVPGVNAFIWERNSLKRHLDAWGLALASRRSELK